MSHAETRRGLSRFAAIGLALVLLACGGGGGEPGVRIPGVAGPYEYRVPTSNGDGWQVADARSSGVDTLQLESLMDHIRRNDPGFRYIDGLLIARNGQLLFSEQMRTQLDFTDEWAGNRDVDLHVLNSVTKSFTATLVGIAIDQGHIPDVGVRVHDYFSDKFPIANWSADKEAMTLEDWLTMRHGYQWNEWSSSYFDPANVNAQMNGAADPIRFLLDRPMAATPGTTFAYSTGVSYGLGRILTVATGQPLADFLDAYLLTPLDINDFAYWNIGGQLHSGSGLYLNLRDMAKLGQLFLDGGLWNGRRIISQAWVEAATTQRVPLTHRGYGYQWWMRTYSAGGIQHEAFYADGLGGQYIFVFPAQDLVVAITGAAYEQSELEQRDLTTVMQDYILPAVL